MNATLQEQIAPEIMHAIATQATASGLSVNDYLARSLRLELVNGQPQELAFAEEATPRNEAAMAAPVPVAPTTTAYQAQAQAGGFLNGCLPDRFCAGRPRFDSEAQVWRVPVLLSYAVIGPVGQVGEVLISPTKGEVVSTTPKEEMMAAAIALYEQYRETIEAPVS